MGAEPTAPRARNFFLMIEEREKPELFWIFFFFPANIVLNRCFFREHEKEVQNRKRGKRPRGRPRKHVVSAGGGGNPQP